jgi:hypothetical protein
VAEPRYLSALGGDHANAAPILSGRLTRRVTERTSEVGLARKLEGERNMSQRLVALLEQLFGELEPLRADIVLRRSADRGLERAGKMEAAETRDRSKAGECQIIFQIGFDVIEHAHQSASIKSCLSATLLETPSLPLAPMPLGLQRRAEVLQMGLREGQQDGRGHRLHPDARPLRKCRRRMPR